MKKFLRSLMVPALGASLLLAYPFQALAAIDYEGYENSTGDLKISFLSRYKSGEEDKEGGVVEIVAYNSKDKVAYVVNGKKGVLSRVSLEKLSRDSSLDSTQDFDLSKIIGESLPGFTYGDMTSVDYKAQANLVAVALQDAAYNKRGAVAFFTDNGSNLELVKIVEAGVQPDMLTFSQDGKMVLVANEGEPREGYMDPAKDPMGSVSLIDTRTYSSTLVDFTSFDSKREELVSKGIILKKHSLPSTDLEPEYISQVGNLAFVSLQEANAIATIDLTKKQFIDISSAGFIDHSQVPIDIDKSDNKYVPKTYPNLYGISMPDGIQALKLGAQTYILTANEGDGREWGEYNNELKETKSPTEAIKTKKKVTYFNPKDYDGLESGKDYLFGGRSFSVLKWNGNSLEKVYNSGSDFESLTAKYLPEYFNTSNDSIEIEDRSGKKGPEPESVTTGIVDGRTYAFISLERISGIMVYDISDPENISYVNYINSRDFSQDIKDDVSPEGIRFVSAKESPRGKALLLAAMEVSGSLAVYELEAKGWDKPEEPNEPKEPKEPEENDRPSLPSIPWNPSIDSSSQKPELESLKDLSLYKAYIKGYPDGDFKPQGDISRGEAASLFSRLLLLEGKERKMDLSSNLRDFSDIQNHWAKEDIEFIYKEGYMVGYPGGLFKPDEKISRAEFVQMIKEYSQPNSASSPFKDAQGHWAQEAIDRAYGNQLIKGYEDNSFRPDKFISRAEAVKIFNNLFNRKTQREDIKEVEGSLSLKVFSDVEKSHWAYLDILDGTNSHTENKDGLWKEIR